MRSLVLILLGISLFSGILAQAPADRLKLSPALQLPKALQMPGDWDTLSLAVKDPAAVRSFLSSLPDSIRILQEYPAAKILIIRCRHSSFLQYILPLPGLLFTDRSHSRAHTELAVGDLDLGVNLIPLAHREFPSINGENLFVSIREDRFDTADIDLRGRILPTPLASSLYSTHATIMASMIGGAGNSFYSGLGVAPAASLCSFNYNSLLPDPDSIYRLYHISVQNHSYGTAIENYYGNEALAHDASAMANPSLLHVFSAGNSGDQSPSSGTYAGIPGMANLTGNFKMAKNILVAGSTDSFGLVLPLSSKGPAYDGRVKPDLVAFGQDGSSGAAALVSGSVLLLQQAYRSLTGNLPPSSLVKAVLLNSADDAGPTGIDYLTGYGSLNTDRALHTMLDGHFLTGSLQTGESKSFPLTVPPGLRQLKISLVWTDPPARPNAPFALVNDLDLLLTGPGGSPTWLPWTLHASPSADSLPAPPVRLRDSLNNTELISLDSPSPGDYSILVSAHNLPQSPQDFSLAYGWDSSASFTWSWPVAGSSLLPRTPGPIRWESGTSGTAALDYSPDNGTSWWSISTAADLSKKYIYWTPPDTCASAILRAVTATHTYYSDTFTIAAIPSLSVGFDCPDSLFLYWHPIKDARAYQLYQLEGPYLLPLTTTRDSGIILDKAGHPARYYAVASLLPDGRTGQHSYTIDYSSQGVACYIRSFTADLLPDPAASLSLTLGTEQRVIGILFEKETSSGFQPLTEIDPSLDPPDLPGSLQWSVLDKSLSPGLNRYRVRLTLTDGRKIYSEVEMVYWLGDKKYIVYPNPVDRPAPLLILSDGSGTAILQLFDLPGRKVYEGRLSDNPAQIPTGSLAKGLYFFRILDNGKPPVHGSILIK